MPIFLSFTVGVVHFNNCRLWTQKLVHTHTLAQTTNLVLTNKLTQTTNLVLTNKLAQTTNLVLTNKLAQTTNLVVTTKLVQRMKLHRQCRLTHTHTHTERASWSVVSLDMLTTAVWISWSFDAAAVCCNFNLWKISSVPVSVFKPDPYRRVQIRRYRCCGARISCCNPPNKENASLVNVCYQKKQI